VSSCRVLIVDAASAGLTSADNVQELSSEHIRVVAVAGNLVGSLGQTDVCKGIRFHIGDWLYRDALDVMSGRLGSLKNIQTVGRNSLHRCNNHDHLMLTTIPAARNILGEQHDVWPVNVERSHHEELEVEEDRGRAA
jgi:hypothetical protein